jgi:disulfide bond formation protein DsbB
MRVSLPVPGVLVAGFSAAMLAGAYAFQYLGGLAPCALCWDQRYAHMAALALGLAAAALARQAVGRLVLAAALAALVAGAGIAVFHAGVEQHWWQGLASCSGAVAGAASVEDLMAQIEAAPVVRCDEIPWSFAGLSMAAWNALLSLAAALGIGRLAFGATGRPRLAATVRR